MKRLTAICWLLTATAMIALVFHISLEVQGLDGDLEALQEEIAQNRKAVHVLEAEWSFLNSPNTLSDLAQRHLEMQPITGAQIIAFDDLPLRPADEDEKLIIGEAQRTEATLVRAETGQ